MALLPAKSKGFFAGFVGDLRKLRATDPETNPAAAIGAILKGGYPATVRLKYERPDNRIADIEQFALLAARYDSLERLIADLILAGDVYGMDSVAGDEPREVLVLSTIHQAKGLEWSHVFIPRLIEESFPHRRALDEPGGEEEERRIFYVAITRAMNELTLTLSPVHPPRRPGPDRLHHAQPVPHARSTRSLLERGRGRAGAGPRPAIPGRASRDGAGIDEAQGRERASRMSPMPRTGVAMSDRVETGVLLVRSSPSGSLPSDGHRRPRRRPAAPATSSASRSSTSRPAAACRWSSCGRSTRSGTSPTATAWSPSTSPACSIRKVFFTVTSHGYEAAKDNFGFRGRASRSPKEGRRGSRSSGSTSPSGSTASPGRGSIAIAS